MYLTKYECIEVIICKSLDINSRVAPLAPKSKLDPKGGFRKTLIISYSINELRIFKISHHGYDELVEYP